MAAVIWNVTVGVMRMRLLESRGPRYTLVVNLVHDPDEFSIVYLGDNRSLAVDTFARKVRFHNSITMVG